MKTKRKKTIFYLFDGVCHDVTKSLLDAGELPNDKRERLSRGTFRKVIF